MKTQICRRTGSQRGALIAEAVVALAILSAVMLPLAFTFQQETRLGREAYFKAVAMEVVDGEMEALVAGEWRAFKPGPQPYPVRAAAATNLPRGGFTLTLNPGRARLEWAPTNHNSRIAVAREATLK